MIEVFQIRPAILTDSVAMSLLNAELGYNATPEEFSSRLQQLLQQSRYSVLVAERAGHVLGWIVGEQRLLLESGAKVEITGLVVATTARRQGVGRKLVEAIEGWAKSQGVSAVTVRSNVSRLESHPFYEGLGYRRTKTQHCYTKENPD